MYMKRILLTWGMVLGYVVLNAYGALMLKYKINQMGAVSFKSFRELLIYFYTLLKSPLSVSAVIAIFASAFVWMAALSRMEISVAYPAAVGLNFFIVVFLGIYFFNETITLFKIIGIVLIFLSMFFLSK